MTALERKGLDMIACFVLGEEAVTDDPPALEAAQAWIRRQLEIDRRRRAKRGNYRGRR